MMHRVKFQLNRFEYGQSFPERCFGVQPFIEGLIPVAFGVLSMLFPIVILTGVTSRQL